MILFGRDFVEFYLHFNACDTINGSSHEEFEKLYKKSELCLFSFSHPKSQGRAVILRHFRAAGCLYAEKYEVSDLAREEKHGIAAAEDIFNGDIIELKCVINCVSDNSEMFSRYISCP